MKISDLIAKILTKIFFPAFINNLRSKSNFIVTKDGITSPALLKATKEYNDSIKSYMFGFYFDSEMQKIVKEFTDEIGRPMNANGKEMSDDEIREWKKVYDSLTPEEKKYWKNKKSNNNRGIK